MIELSKKDEKLIKKLADFGENGMAAVAESFVEVEEKLAELQSTITSSLDLLQNTLKKKLESELVIEIDKEELRGDPGENGKDYVLTEQDKDEIATLAMMDIEVPVVEKIVEKTEVIKEIPIVTENVVEKALYETPEQIVEKINSLDEDGPKIDAKHIANIPTATHEIIRQVGGGMVEAYSGSFKVGSSSRIRFEGATVSVDNDGAIKVTNTTSGGVGAWSTPPETPAEDGSVLVFTVGSTAPTDVVGDRSLSFEGLDYTYAAGQITFLPASAPTQSVRYR